MLIDGLNVNLRLSWKQSLDCKILLCTNKLSLSFSSYNGAVSNIKRCKDIILFLKKIVVDDLWVNKKFYCVNISLRVLLVIKTWIKVELRNRGFIVIFNQFSYAYWKSFFVFSFYLASESARKIRCTLNLKIPICYYNSNPTLFPSVKGLIDT